MIEDDELFVEAAAGVLRSSSGLEALTRCEWDPIVRPGVSDDLRVMGALFRAHGRTLARTPALGLLASSVWCGEGSAPLDRNLIAGFNARRDGDEVSFWFLGHEPGTDALLDLGDSVFLAGSSALRETSSDALEPGFATRVVTSVQALEPLSVTDADARRERADSLVRVAIAREQLGICDSLLELASNYASVRVQFGKPISTFQAVQHVLADAAVDAVALDAACRAALEASEDPDDFVVFSQYLKALGGRTVRRVLQASLQTLGAIGFTWEHEHHRYLRRSLTLDAVGLTSIDLTRQIGADARKHGIRRPNVGL
jgi:hypothetical protein